MYDLLEEYVLRKKIMVKIPPCMDCKNYIGRNNEDKDICKAFPDGIPDNVFWGDINHKTHIDGDNGYKFESLYESTPQ